MSASVSDTYGLAHLPECPTTTDPHGLDDGYACPCECQCEILRACEQRVRNQDIATHHADLQEAKALLASRDEAWYAGVDAAWEAVAAAPRHYWVSWAIEVDAALSAIDALKEKP